MTALGTRNVFIALGICTLLVSERIFSQTGPSGTGIGGYNLYSTADKGFSFDFNSTGRQDHLLFYRPGTGIAWIIQNNAGSFSPSFQSAGGIGGYDLSSAADRGFALDYDGSGRLDHLVFYRPGTGIFWILGHQGTSFPVLYKGGGIGGYDLSSAADQSFAFDYASSGKQDHIILTRPVSGYVWILKNQGGTFVPVFTSSSGIGFYNYTDPADKMIAFDYDSSGKADHLVLYRPGTGIIWILKNDHGTFSSVFKSSSGIANYNVLDPADRVLAFDYDGSGKQDHLALYRPGKGIIWILKNVNGVFSAVYSSGSGIGYYDLSSPADQVFAFDYDGSGKQNYLVLYRPGTGIVWVVKNNAGTFSPAYVTPTNPLYPTVPAREYIHLNGQVIAVENKP